MRQVAGKICVVLGYGDVGKGCAQAYRGMSNTGSLIMGIVALAAALAGAAMG